MKKCYAFIAVLLILTAAAFADVSVKKLADGQVEVTFFYGNPRASEVVVAGDFTDWQNGALPMTKSDRGWTLVKTVPAGTVMKYKFISDGNWTSDIKAPDTVDDGFGGKNGLVDVDALAAASAPAGTAADASPSKKADIKFMTWTVAGTQAKFRTQGVVDKSKKGMDFDSATIGVKSYNKLTGNLLPDMPFYVEIALAETELDDAYSSNNPIYLAQKSASGANVDTVNIEDGIKQFFTGILTNPVAYLGRTDDNSDDDDGPGSNPYLGHLKFGINSPWVNWYNGFNYAKPDVRQAVIWKTVDGNWDAGYQHIGGFNSFSLGSKIQHIFGEDVTLDAGFAPNKTGDRKGTKYGYWGWAGVKYEDLAVDFQSNGMYNGNYLFDDPVEHDFIIGAKDKFGGLSVAAQALIATHQMSSAQITANGASSQADYFGYSTDVFYRTNTFDGIQNIAAEAKIGYDGPSKLFGITADYRMRGAQASMLFLRENHDDGTFDLSKTLGELNSQNVGLTGYITPVEPLTISLAATAEMPLEKLSMDNTLVQGYVSDSAWTGWYKTRCGSDMMPLFGVTGGAEYVATPTVSYKLSDNMSLSAYGTVKYNAYQCDSDSLYSNEYAASDSSFLFKRAGATFSVKDVNSVINGIAVYYGLDNSNSVRLFNTLVGSVKLPGSITATAAVGVKTVKNTDAAANYDKNINNPFAFALGAAKKLSRIQKPVVYAQFVYNMDPYKNFGDGQDNLALEDANVSARWDKAATVGDKDAVDWYDGYAAVRVGIRWDF
jgi:hypothetical protein